MQKILKLLSESTLVDHFVYNSPPTSPEIKLHELVVYFVDNSELHVREIQKVDNRKYSYHWQDSENKLITRWDTAKHHNHLDSYPHHKHDPDLQSSKEMILEEVLEIIFSKLKQ